MSYHCADCPADGRCKRCRRKDTRRKARRRDGHQHDLPKGLAQEMAVEVIRLGTMPPADAGQADAEDADLADRIDAWLLPEDGISDGHAVLIAIDGQRHVALTYSERVLAATVILAGRGTAKDVCVHLSLPHEVTEDECRNSPVLIVRRLLGSVD